MGTTSKGWSLKSSWHLSLKISEKAHLLRKQVGLNASSINESLLPAMQDFFYISPIQHYNHVGTGGAVTSAVCDHTIIDILDYSYIATNKAVGRPNAYEKRKVMPFIHEWDNAASTGPITGDAVYFHGVVYAGAANGNQIYALLDGRSNILINIASTGFPYNALYVHNDTLKVICNGGTNTRHSKNGRDWYDGPPMPATQCWSVCAALGDLVVVIPGDSFTTGVAYSANGGDTWSVSTITARSWNCIAAGAGIFVATCSDGVVNYATSTTGATWTNRTFTVVRDAVAFVNGRFFATNSGSGSETVILHSTNGTTWTSMAMPVAGAWSTPIFVDGVYFVYEGNGNKYYTSTTGTSGWTEFRPLIYQSCIGFSGYFRSISEGNNGFIYNTSDGVSYSTDSTYKAPSGFSYRNVGSNPFIANSVYPIIFGSNNAIQIDSSNANIKFLIANSTAYTGTGLGPTASGYWIVLTNGAIFTIINSLTNELWTAPCDLKSAWTSRAAVPASSLYWGGGEYGNGLFIVICPGIANSGQTTDYLTSSDGITWTKRALPIAKNWYSVAYSVDLNRWVIVSNDGGVVTSTDGLNWSVGTIATGYGKHVVSQNSVFVTTHQSADTIATSTNGIDWETRVAVAGLYIASLTGGGGWFVALVGQTSAYISADGITWYSYSTAGQYVIVAAYNPEDDSFLCITNNMSVVYDLKLSGLRVINGIGKATLNSNSIITTGTLQFVFETGIGKCCVAGYAVATRSVHNYYDGVGKCIGAGAGYYVTGGTAVIIVEGGVVAKPNSNFYVPQRAVEIATGKAVASNYGYVNIPKFAVGRGIVKSTSSIVVSASYPGFSCTVNDTGYIVSEDSFNVEYLYAFGTSSIYALAGGTICKSINYGVTWSLLNDDLIFGHSVLATNNTGSIILSIRNDTTSIAKSSNSGATFSELIALTSITNVGDNGDGYDNFNVVHLSSTGQYQIVCTSSGFVYLSADYGVSWTDKGQPDYSTIYSCMILDSGIMLVVTDHSKILRSADFGTTWDEVLSDYAFIKIAGTADGRVLCVVSDTIHVSYDIGLTWQSITDLFDSSLQTISFSSDGNYAVVSGYENSFISSNSGASWTMVPSFITTSVVSFNSGDFCFINVDDTTTILSGRQIKIVHNIGAMVQPSSSVIIRIHHPRINNGFPTFQGTNAQVLGLMNYGIYYDESISSINGLLGGNDGSKSNTLGVMDFGVVNKINMDSLTEIGTIGDGLHSNTSAISGLMNDTTGSNSVPVAIDNVLNIINNAQVIDLANNEGKVSISSVNDLTDATIISVAHTVQIILDGSDITKYVTEATISSAESNIFDTVNISIADGRNWNVDVALSEVMVVLHDATYTFLVEEFTGADNKRELWGRSLPAVYDEPWASASVWSELNVTATTAHGLANEIIGAPVIWQVDDWPLPPKFEVSGTPIMAVQMIAQAAGGIVTASADSNSIVVRRRWPVRSVNMTSANILLSRENAIEDVSVDKSEIMGYGKVIVHGWEPEDTLPDFELEGEAILGQDAFIRLYWRGPDHPSFTKWITDGNATFVETVTEPLTEVVVFDGSSASVNKPIWSLTEFEWLGNDYGDISWLENGYSTNLESSDSPYGVAKVVYNTTYERWKLTNQAVETVQFGVEVTQGSVSAEVIFDSGGIAAGEEKVPLLGSVAACVQYGTAFLDETKISKTATTTIPRTAHLGTGTVVRVEDEVLGISTFGKLKSVQTLITATRITQNVQVDIC